MIHKPVDLCVFFIGKPRKIPQVRRREPSGAILAHQFPAGGSFDCQLHEGEANLLLSHSPANAVAVLDLLLPAVKFLKPKIVPQTLNARIAALPKKGGPSNFAGFVGKVIFNQAADHVANDLGITWSEFSSAAQIVEAFWHCRVLNEELAGVGVIAWVFRVEFHTTAIMAQSQVAVAPGILFVAQSQQIVVFRIAGIVRQRCGEMTAGFGELALFQQQLGQMQLGFLGNVPW
jgi:hypothetical protein